MIRREFLILSSTAAIASTSRASSKDAPSYERLHSVDTPRVAITIDDPNVKGQPMLTQQECAARIIDTLSANQLRTALFVCGKRIDSVEGSDFIRKWDDAGHLICNHTYSHGSYNYPTITREKMSDDILRAEDLIRDYSHFTKFLRFPYLKEGDTAEKRDAMREWMHANGYRNGYVTIDASDWYIDDRLRARLTSDPKADLEPYKKFYLEHLWARSIYYNDLALALTGRQISHTILLHHTLTNALFLGDLIAMYRSKGWQVVSAADSYKDPVFQREPKSLPAGESLIWAMAKESGKYDGKLRYPGEDDTYEKPRMDELGL